MFLVGDVVKYVNKEVLDYDDEACFEIEGSELL